MAEGDAPQLDRVSNLDLFAQLVPPHGYNPDRLRQLRQNHRRFSVQRDGSDDNASLLHGLPGLDNLPDLENLPGLDNLPDPDDLDALPGMRSPPRRHDADNASRGSPNYDSRERPARRRSRGSDSRSGQRDGSLLEADDAGPGHRAFGNPMVGDRPQRESLARNLLRQAGVRGSTLRRSPNARSPPWEGFRDAAPPSAIPDAVDQPRGMTLSDVRAMPAYAEAMDELERLRAGPSLPDHHMGGHFVPPQRPPPRAPAAGNTYRTLYRQMLQESHAAPGARSEPAAGYEGHKDPDYAEKVELQLKLDEMRSMGFNVPVLSLDMPLADFQMQFKRRTISMNKVGLVKKLVTLINSGAFMLQMINNMCGPLLPMHNYADRVREGTATSEFQYAMYQLVMRFKSTQMSSPVVVILLVLLLPLLEGIVSRVLIWLSKRFPFTRAMNLQAGTVQPAVSTGLSSLASLFTDGAKNIPSNIPGISPNMPEGQAPAAPGAGAGLGGLGGLLNSLFAKPKADAPGYTLPAFVTPSPPRAAATTAHAANAANAAQPAPPGPSAPAAPAPTFPPAPPVPPAHLADRAAHPADRAARPAPVTRAEVRNPKQIPGATDSAIFGVPNGIITTAQQLSGNVSVP